MAIIDGDNQDNLLQGTNQADRINGFGGDDTLEGLGGNDRLTGGLGEDLIDGGDGFDIVVEELDADFELSQSTLETTTSGQVEEDTLFSIEQASLKGGSRNNRFRAANFDGKVRFNGLGGNDDIEGSNGDDTLLGAGGNDTISGLGGNDRINGGGGNDLINIEGLIDNDEINGGSGIDTLAVKLENRERTITLSDTEIVGTGTTSLNSIENVIITAQSSGRRIDASEFSGNTELVGTDNSDTFTGGSGQDQIFGNGGNDRITSSDGTNSDVLDGGSGNDTFVINQGAHTIVGGTGIDTVSNSVLAVDGTLDVVVTDTQLTLNQQTSSLSSIERASFGGRDGDDSFISTNFSGDVNFNGNNGNDFIDAGSGDDALFGGSGNDTIFATSGDNVLSGDNGNDLLGGGTGNDLLIGGSGDDNLLGGGGNDTLFGGNQFGAAGTIGTQDQLFGGAGADLFVFGTNRGDAPAVFYDDGDPFTRDGGDVGILRDFEQGIDKIQLLGNASDYATDFFEFDGVSGTGIFRLNSTPGGAQELIGFADGVSSLDLNSNTFVFVPEPIQ